MKKLLTLLLALVLTSQLVTPALAEILPEDLDALISANAFALKPGKVIFGLRGAHLAGADRRENVEGFTIVAQRPDHRTFRCIIGVYDPVARRLWMTRG